MGVTSGGGDYYSKVSQSYSDKLYGGMSRTEWANANRAGLSQRIEQSKVETTNENIAKIQNAGKMYGLNLDAASIFVMANTDGNGVLSNKEANAFMSKLPQLAQMYGSNGSSGSSSGGSSAMSLLNGITDAAGNIFGIADNSNNSGDSGGGFLKKAGDFLGGLLS